jgi:HAD superfamily hydrolase (TIGR01458 family)
MERRKALDGLLLDIDGVLTVSWKALPGAVETVGWIERSGIPFLLLTNTTTPGRKGLADLLSAAGFDVPPDQIVTAAVATGEYLRSHHPGARCFLLGRPDLGNDFQGIDLVDTRVDVVVVAGADEAFTWGNLTKALQMLRSGASLVAMHRNMTWMTTEGLKLDAGAYLIGLEQAAGVRATVIGKPSPDFFQHAVRMLQRDTGEVAMVGDDLENDVVAAQRFGIRGILVRTGKFRPEDLNDALDAPDHVLDSIADLPGLVEELRT